MPKRQADKRLSQIVDDDEIARRSRVKNRSQLLSTDTEGHLWLLL